MLSEQILRNRYQILKLLGSGSFGTTYLAKDLDLPKHPFCVVKNLRQSQNPEDLEMIIRFFDKEAEALYRLGNEHNQIPKLFAHFQENGQFYLVQEFVDGHDLSQEIFTGNKLSEATVIQLLKDILEVLTIIHNKNIIHRDIKAQNLMRRNSDGKIMLIDFGTVKEISGLTINPLGQTETSVVIGTNGYMPNEQLCGYPKLCSDIYAVGMLGIYALTGVRPQELPKDPNTLEVIWKDMVSVSPFLANILDKMVRYNFNERYPTAFQALEALTKSYSTSTSNSPSIPSSSSNFLTALISNNKFWVSIGIGMLLLVSVGFLVTWMIGGWNALTHQKDSSGFKVTTVDAEICPSIPKNFKPSVPNTLPDWIDQNSGAMFYGIPEDTRTGKGTVVLSDSVYYGYVKQGVFTGCGKILFKNGDRYTGQFNNSLYEGRGNLIFVKRTCKYVGEFQQGKFNGQGILTCKNGTYKNGTWNDKSYFL
jgi:eukaryotic-like serine/threonine-protein kinase